MSFKTKTDILHTPLTQWLRKYMYVTILKTTLKKRPKSEMLVCSGL